MRATRAHAPHTGIPGGSHSPVQRLLFEFLSTALSESTRAGTSEMLVPYVTDSGEHNPVRHTETNATI